MKTVGCFFSLTLVLFAVSNMLNNLNYRHTNGMEQNACGTNMALKAKRVFTKSMNSKLRIRNFSFWLNLEELKSKSVVLPFRTLICLLFTNSLITKIIRIRSK